MKKIPIILIILLSISPLSSTSKLCRINLINKENKNISLSAEVANTPYLLNRGLMYRKYLPKNSGMIFVFKKESMHTFWMKNTYIPLSIAYINKKGIINEIYDMKPLDIGVVYPTIKPAKYALEVNRGWFKKNNIIKGSRLILNGCFSK